MQLVHSRNDGERRVLASDVEVADGLLSKAIGLMFRRSVPEGFGLAFRFDRPGRRSLHMLFVPFPIDSVWVVDDEVIQTKRLSAWTGVGWGTADTIYELPAGAAEGVKPGDKIVLDSDEQA